MSLSLPCPLLSTARAVTMRLFEQGRWTAHRPGQDVRVYYGFDHIHKVVKKHAGGLVKLEDLDKAFPNILQGAEILYLVSSGLPVASKTMAAMAKKAGARVVVNQNGVAYPGWCPDEWEAFNRPFKAVLELADHVFYQSVFCRESADRYLGERHDSSEICYNPVDTSFYVPGDRNQPGDPVVLLLAGTHQAFYRVRTAVEALALLRKKINARLIIAGRNAWKDREEDADQECSAFCREAGLEDHVQRVGPYTRSEGLALFQKADVYLHTKYNDPCPRVVVEAMACGLPVVFSASGGVPELVGSEAGQGVEAPRDWERDHPPGPEPLAGAVLDVLSRYEELSRGARTRSVERFDVRPWIEQHRRVFTEGG